MNAARPETGNSTNGWLALLGLFMMAMSVQGVREIHHFYIGFGLVAMYQAEAWLVAVWVVLNRPANRWTLPLIISIAAGCRLICIFSPPFLSSDIYRYIWDGWVQGAGINPFRYIPADQHLAFLRDLNIYPDINRRDYAHTIYPPGAQIFFYLVTRIGGSVVWMKAVITACEAGTIWVLARLLQALQMPRENVLVYAWHPLVLWEVASSGHVDGVALPLIALALLFSIRRRAAGTGIALAGATLIKLYPLALFPALYRRDEDSRLDWKMPLLIALLVAAGYGCYSSVGIHVLGFLPEYAKEEGLDSGSRYFLLTLARNTLHWQALPTAAFYGVAALVLGGLTVFAFWKSRTGPRTAIGYSFAIAAALMMLFSSHYPWYYLWLLPFLSVIPNTTMIYFVTACFYLYTTQLANPGPAMYYMFQWLYGTTAVLALWCKGMNLLKARRARQDRPQDFAIYPASVRNS